MANVDYRKYEMAIYKAFKNKKKLLSTELKTDIGFKEDKLWGTLISALLSKKILVKGESSNVKYDGKPVNYYYLGPQFNSSLAKNILIIDQNGKHHEYDNENQLQETINNILMKNPLLQLQIYEKKETYTAKIDILKH